MRIRATLLLVCLLSVAVLMGCGTQETALESPEQVVRAYIEARESSDPTVAHAMLTAYAADHIDESEATSSAGIYNLTVGDNEPVKLDGTEPDHWKSYAEVRVVTVTYGRPARDASDSPSGNSEPVIVVRETESSPWRIELDNASD